MSLLSRFLARIGIVICRRDLPVNPHWREKGYPNPHCWEIDEFFEAASKAGPGSRLWQEARRIYWESYWRLLGRYKRGRPFFDTYIVEDHVLKRLKDRETWVLENIIASAMAYDIVPPEAKEQTYKLYRVIFGRLVK